MSRLHGDSFQWEHVHIIGKDAPLCWNAVIDGLDSAKLLWNWVWFLEDDIVLPENGLGALFDRIFTYREVRPLTMGATYQTHVFRQPRMDCAPDRLSSITWKDEELGLVKQCGWYCLLLDKKALQVFPRPMFEIDPKDPFSWMMGQDQYMTKKLTEHGWDIVCIAEKTIPHLYVKTFKYKGALISNWSGVHEILEY